MVDFRMPGLFFVLGFLLCQRSEANHACSDEAASACPDESGAQLGRCLQDPEQHQTETTISSGCSDFIALNQACEGDIEKFCDESYFSEDTVLCLTEWTRMDDLSAKCKTVVKWAAPGKDDEGEGEGGEEEDTMSETEKAEKKAWHEKRKANRADAVELRRKEEEKEAERKYAEEHPEEYAEQKRMQEEEKRQKAEIKRRERMHQAAIARKKMIDAGLDPDAPPDDQKKAKKGGKGKDGGSSWIKPVASFVAIAAVIGGVYYAISSGMIKLDGGKKGRGGGGKKKRG